MSEPVAAFKYAKLGEHADILAGPPFNSDAFTDNSEDVPLVKGENVQQGYVDWNIAKRWPITNVDAYKRFSLVPGDVVVEAAAISGGEGGHDLSPVAPLGGQGYRILLKSLSAIRSGVRRQIIWDSWRLRLAECRPHLWVDVKRRSCGVASADVRW